MGSERTLVTRWKSVVDPSVKKSSDDAGEAAENAGKRSVAAWTAVGTAVGNLVAGALERAGERAIEFAKDSFRAASDLKESVNVTQLTFGKYSTSMEAFYKNAAKTIGMSETAARESSASVGGLLQNMGLGKKASVEWSEKLLGLAADMGSAFNSDPADAIEAIGAGLRGESEPLRRYNVMLSDAALKQEAMSMGLYKGKGNLTNAAKAQAALSLIMKQTSRVQGDFANTSAGAANAARIQAAKVEDLKAKVANSLLPAQEAWLAFTNDRLIPGLSGLSDSIRTGIDWIQANAQPLASWGVGIGVVTAGLTILSVVQGAQAAGGFVKYLLTVAQATKAWAVVQGILNVVMSANPIALVVIAIAALVAGIIYAYNNCKEFRQVVDVTFKAIADAGVWLWNNALQPALKGIVMGFGWVMDGLAAFLDGLGNIPGFEWAKGAAASVRDVGKAARDAANGIKAIPIKTKVTVTAQDEASAKLATVKSQLAELKDKLIKAKAEGDTTEVDKLQRKIDDLKDKKVKLQAEVEKGTVLSKVKIVPGKGNGAKFSLIAMAGGGILGGAERHVAQIAKAGAMRLWAEEETGGEGYVPLAASKRSTSVPIWWEIGRRLGVVQYANGGVSGGQAQPSSVSELLAAIHALGLLITAAQERLVNETLRAASSTPRPMMRLG